jgi:hypothetical protein
VSFLRFNLLLLFITTTINSSHHLNAILKIKVCVLVVCFDTNTCLIARNIPQQGENREQKNPTIIQKIHRRIITHIINLLKWRLHTLTHTQQGNNIHLTLLIIHMDRVVTLQWVLHRIIITNTIITREASTINHINGTHRAQEDMLPEQSLQKDT